MVVGLVAAASSAASPDNLHARRRHLHGFPEPDHAGWDENVCGQLVDAGRSSGTPAYASHGSERR